MSKRKTTNHCKACNSGYYLNGTFCSAYMCTETLAGKGCASCKTQANRTAHDQCASCYSSYGYSGMHCNTCDNSKWVDTTDSDKCKSCPTGYTCNGTAKVANWCTPTSQDYSNKASAGSIMGRTDDNITVNCHAGYSGGGVVDTGGFGLPLAGLGFRRTG